MFSDKLDALYSKFTLGEARAGSDGSYKAEVVMSSASWRIESKHGTQYIQGGVMVPGKSEEQNSYQGELVGQVRVMCVIKIMDSILGSTALVINICDNLSALGQASIHPEALIPQWKQAYPISRLSDVYHSIDSGILLVHNL